MSPAGVVLRGDVTEWAPSEGCDWVRAWTLRDRDIRYGTGFQGHRQPGWEQREADARSGQFSLASDPIRAGFGEASSASDVNEGLGDALTSYVLSMRRVDNFVNTHCSGTFAALRQASRARGAAPIVS
jgi:hypothetical protein